MYQLHLCRGVRPLNECPRYDIKPSASETPVLELWGMWSTPSLPLLPGPLRSGIVVSVMVQSMGQIELFNHLLDLKPFMLNRITSV